LQQKYYRINLTKREGGRERERERERERDAILLPNDLSQESKVSLIL